jgi:hypothetical protein
LAILIFQLELEQLEGAVGGDNRLTNGSYFPVQNDAS